MTLPPDFTVTVSDAVDFVAKLPDASVDMVMTSPPYDAVRDYASGASVDLNALGFQVARVLVDGGVAVLVMQDQTKKGRKSLTTFRTAVSWCDAGLGLFECCIYHRHGVPGAYWARRFRVDHEYILVFVKGSRPQYFDKGHMMVPAKHAGTRLHGTRRLTNGRMGPLVGVIPDTKCPGTVLAYSPSNCEGCADADLKAKHPATYPDRLASDFIRCFCPPGGLVVDPFVGSGTTLVAALLADRRAIGGDLSPEYCALARERLERWSFLMASRSGTSFSATASISRERGFAGRNRRRRPTPARSTPRRASSRG